MPIDQLANATAQYMVGEVTGDIQGQIIILFIKSFFTAISGVGAYFGLRVHPIMTGILGIISFLCVLSTIASLMDFLNAII